MRPLLIRLLTESKEKIAKYTRNNFFENWTNPSVTVKWLIKRKIKGEGPSRVAREDKRNCLGLEQRSGVRGGEG